MLPLGYQDPNMDPSCCELLLVNGVNSCAYDAGYETDHTALSPPSSDGTGWESEGDICSVGGCCASGMIQTMHPMRSTSYFYVEDRRPQQTTAVYHACVAPENESSTFHDSQAAQKLSGDVNREDFVASNGVVYDLGSDIRGAMMEGMDCCTVITDQHHQYHDVPMLTGPQGQSSTQFCAAGTTCIHSEGPQESCCQSSEGMIENGAFEPCCSMLYNHEPYYGAKHTTSSRDQLCRPVATVQFDINQEGVMFSRDWQKVESPCERIEVVGASQLSSMATQDACHYVQINKAPFEDDDCASYLRIDDDEDYWSRRRYSQKEAERVLGPVDDDHLLEVGANGLSLSPVPSPIPPDTPPSLYDMSSETMLAPGFHQAGGADEDIGRGTLLQWTTEELLEESSNGSSSLSEPSTPSMGQTSPSSFSPNPHQVRDYICRWKHCWLKFEGQTELVNHIEARHVEGKARKGDEFICSWEDCPRKKKPFNARYKLLIHMRVHSGEKPNKCQHPGCSQAFSRLENLKIHMRSHTGERPYVCQYPKCPKAFSNSSDRAKHQRTHIDTRPYACTYGECGKRYTDPSSLRKHMKNHPTTMTLGLQQEYSSHYPMSNYCQEEDYTLGPSAMSHQW